MPDHRQTRQGLIEAAVGARWSAESSDPQLKRATQKSLTQLAKDCMKSLLPVVARQTHQSKPATQQLMRLLNVGEPFLKTLATIGDHDILQPDQVAPTTRLAAWATNIAFTAYRVHKDRRLDGLTAYVQQKGPLRDEKHVRSVGGKWLRAVRTTAVDIISDGGVGLESLGELEARLASLPADVVWSRHPDFSGPVKPVSPDRQAALEEAARLLKANKSRFLGVIWREGQTTGSDAEDILQDAAVKIGRLEFFGPEQANMGYLISVVKSVTLNHVKRRAKDPQIMDEPLKVLSTGQGKDDIDAVLDEVAGRWTAPELSVRPSAHETRSAIVGVLNNLISSGEEQHAASAVLSAHQHVLTKVQKMPIRTRADLPALYLSYYSATLGRASSIASVRANQRLTEFRYAVINGEFPPQEEPR